MEQVPLRSHPALANPERHERETEEDRSHSEESSCREVQGREVLGLGNLAASEKIAGGNLVSRTEETGEEQCYPDNDHEKP
jgi:hypothetical protein